ncbi:MAG TPA: hypothetical protein ENK18_11260 [Deltaproteobacteria bacterium]|nr:hypothetical protein [Deltaproteobacteria bacterium]
MLTRELEARLRRHRPVRWWWRPLRSLRRVRAVSEGDLFTWVGQRPRGTRELVRHARGEAAVELLLNELDVLSRLGELEGLPPLLWSARPGSEELMAGLAWSERHELVYPLDFRWLLSSFVRLAEIVGAIHDRGWLHGDLKPEAVHWSADPLQTLLWDLRLAQEPGEPKFEAFSARYASPEQVAGDPMLFSSDVYALGVMLYSLFIRSRFPSILMPRAPGPAGIEDAGASLSAITAIGAFDDEEMPLARAVPAPPSARGDDQTILGAKVLFAMELDRVMRRTADIGIGNEVIAIIGCATSQKPADRYPNGAVFAAELEAILMRR